MSPVYQALHKIARFNGLQNIKTRSINQKRVSFEAIARFQFRNGEKRSLINHCSCTLRFSARGLKKKRSTARVCYKYEFASCAAEIKSAVRVA